MPSHTSSSSSPSSSAGDENSNKFQCEYCQRFFKIKHNFDRHLTIHTDEKRFQCSQCELAFSRAYILKDHVKSTHDPPKPFQCSFCKRGYKTNKTLSKHMQNHKENSSICDLEKPLIHPLVISSDSSNKLSSSSNDQLPARSANSSGDQHQSQTSLEYGSIKRSLSGQLDGDLVKDLAQNNINKKIKNSSSEIHQMDWPLSGKPSLKEEQNLNYPSSSIKQNPFSLQFPTKSEPDSPNRSHQVNSLLNHDNLPQKADASQFLVISDSAFHDYRASVPSFLKQSLGMVNSAATSQQHSQPFDLTSYLHLQNVDNRFASSWSNLSSIRNSLNMNSPTSTVDNWSNRSRNFYHQQKAPLPPLPLQQHKCLYCPNSRWLFVGELEEHLAEHLTKLSTLYRCEHCSELRFDTQSKLDEHFDDKHFITQYQCVICRENFSSQTLVEKHVKSSHGAELVSYGCTLCPELSYPDTQELRKHFRQQHCPLISSMFSTNKRKVSNFGIDSLIKDESNNQHTTNITRKSLQSEEIGDSCNNLSQNNKCNTNPKVLRCAICQEKLVNIEDFMQHNSKHRDDNEEPERTSRWQSTCCIICRQSLSDEQDLRIHGELHYAQHAHRHNPFLSTLAQTYLGSLIPPASSFSPNSTISLSDLSVGTPSPSGDYHDQQIPIADNQHQQPTNNLLPKIADKPPPPPPPLTTLNQCEDSAATTTASTTIEPIH